MLVRILLRIRCYPNTRPTPSQYHLVSCCFGSHMCMSLSAPRNRLWPLHAWLLQTSRRTRKPSLDILRWDIITHNRRRDEDHFCSMNHVVRVDDDTREKWLHTCYTRWSYVRSPSWELNLYQRIIDERFEKKDGRIGTDVGLMREGILRTWG